jgi:hypothetical protein
MVRSQTTPPDKSGDAPKRAAWFQKTSARLELLRRGIKSPAVLKMEAEAKAHRADYQALRRRKRRAPSPAIVPNINTITNCDADHQQADGTGDGHEEHMQEHQHDQELDDAVEETDVETNFDHLDHDIEDMQVEKHDGETLVDDNDETDLCKEEGEDLPRGLKYFITNPGAKVFEVTAEFVRWNNHQGRVVAADGRGEVGILDQGQSIPADWHEVNPDIEDKGQRIQLAHVNQDAAATSSTQFRNTQPHPQQNITAVSRFPMHHQQPSANNQVQQEPMLPHTCQQLSQLSSKQTANMATQPPPSRQVAPDTTPRPISQPDVRPFPNGIAAAGSRTTSRLWYHGTRARDPAGRERWLCAYCKCT